MSKTVLDGLRTSKKGSIAIAAAAGAALACAFAPLGWWPLAFVCPAVLMWLWQDATPRRAAATGFAFSAGTFAVGTYWLYVSIHVFGRAPTWLAVTIMAALVAIMGLYYGALGYAIARWLPERGAVRWLVGTPGAWLLLEWFRGWFLSGFSWLSLGYTQTDTWLVGFAPIVGVYGLTALVLVIAGALVTLLLGDLRSRWIAAAVLVLPWPVGAWLQGFEWTREAGPPVAVAIAQGAVSQDLKWLEENRVATLRRYRELNSRVLGTPLIVWPESAPPDLANNLAPYLGSLWREAEARGSHVVLGVVRVSDDGNDYYNSVLALAEEARFYDKRHLVPFGEFFPVPDFVRAWLRLASLPYSDFTRGAEDQAPLRAAGLALALTICYEDAYGSSQLAALRTADALVNVTNDAWFGRSTARHQHFQIARMRAIEARRYMVRAANDGVSGIIGPHGEVLATAPEYEPAVLRGTIVPRQGLPPYARAGNWPVVLAALVGMLLCMIRRRAGIRDAAASRAPPGAPAANFLRRE